MSPSPCLPHGRRPASRANSPSAHTPPGAGGRPGSRSATPRRPGSLGWPGEGRPRPPPPCDWPVSDNREGQRQGHGSRQHVHQLRGGTTVSRRTREQRPGPCSAGPSVPPSPRPPGMGPDELLTVYPIMSNPPPMGRFRRDFDPTRRWLAGGPEGGSEVQRASRPIPMSLDWPLLTLGPASRNLHASPSPSASRVWGSPSVWVTGGPSGSPGRATGSAGRDALHRKALRASDFPVTRSFSLLGGGAPQRLSSLTKILSKAEGVPPLCTCPRMVTRVSYPSCVTTSCGKQSDTGRHLVLCAGAGDSGVLSSDLRGGDFQCLKFAS